MILFAFRDTRSRSQNYSRGSGALEGQKKGAQPDDMKKALLLVSLSVLFFSQVAWAERDADLAKIYSLIPSLH